MNKKVEELVERLKDAEYAKKIFSMSIEEAQIELANSGLDFSIEELTNFANGLRDSMSDNEELTEQDLENVAGGGKGGYMYDAGYKAGRVLRQVFNIGLGFVSSIW